MFFNRVGQYRNKTASGHNRSLTFPRSRRTRYPEYGLSTSPFSQSAVSPRDRLQWLGSCAWVPNLDASDSQRSVSAHMQRNCQVKGCVWLCVESDCRRGKPQRCWWPHCVHLARPARDVRPYIETGERHRTRCRDIPRMPSRSRTTLGVYSRSSGHPECRRRADGNDD